MHIRHIKYFLKNKKRFTNIFRKSIDVIYVSWDFLLCACSCNNNKIDDEVSQCRLRLCAFAWFAHFHQVTGERYIGLLFYCKSR